MISSALPSGPTKWRIQSSLVAPAVSTMTLKAAPSARVRSPRVISAISGSAYHQAFLYGATHSRVASGTCGQKLSAGLTIAASGR